MGKFLDETDNDDLDAEAIEEWNRREEEHALSPAGIAEGNESQKRRRHEFRVAADRVVEAWRELPEVEAVVLFGSVAVPPWKEVPRFQPYRRMGIALWHECMDVDLALWLSRTDGLNALRAAKNRALSRLYEETRIGVASHQVDVFIMEPDTDRYLGRLCDFAKCPKGKPECLVAGCGETRHLRRHEGFVFRPDALAGDRAIPLFDRRSGLLRQATEGAVTGKEEGRDGGMG